MQMWAHAHIELGLTADAFYDLTPRQYDALAKRKERFLEANEFMLAQLTSAVVNFSHRAPKETTKPRDFMLSQFRVKSPAERPKRRSRKTIADEFRAVIANFMRA